MRLSALSRWAQPSPISNLALLLSAGSLGSGLPTWIQARVSTVLESQLLEVTGAQAAPQLTALAVVALLAGLALRLGRRGLRYLLAAVLLLAGAGLVAASAGVLANPQAAAAHQVNGVTGTTAVMSSLQLYLWARKALRRYFRNGSVMSVRKKIRIYRNRTMWRFPLES